MPKKTKAQKDSLYTELKALGKFKKSFAEMDDDDREALLRKYLADGVVIYEHNEQIMHIEYPTPEYRNVFIDREIRYLYKWVKDQEIPPEKPAESGGVHRVPGGRALLEFLANNSSPKTL